MIFSLLGRLLFFPTLGWNLLLAHTRKDWHWWDWIDEHVLLGALPFRADAQKLYDLGIRAVVNTCEEYAGPQAEYTRLGIEQLRVPLPDFIAPTLDAVEKGVAFIDQKIAEGKKVYVHCKAGRGRSATVVACYLIKHGASPEEAQTALSAKRRQVLKRIGRREVVEKFFESQGAI